MRLPTCPECYNQGLLVSGKEVYPHRPDLYKKWFYVCKKHDTRVGCHSNTKEPLSSKMAGGQLRLLRSQTHGMLDPLWRNGHFTSRGVAYSWLAREMKISLTKTNVLKLFQYCTHIVVNYKPKRMKNCKKTNGNPKIQYLIR